MVRDLRLYGAVRRNIVSVALAVHNIWLLEYRQVTNNKPTQVI